MIDTTVMDRSDLVSLVEEMQQELKDERHQRSAAIENAVAAEREKREALEASLDRIRNAWSFDNTGFHEHCDDHVNLPMARYYGIEDAIDEAPETCLAQRDARVAEEALDRLNTLMDDTHVDKAPTVNRAMMHVRDAMATVKQQITPARLRASGTDEIAARGVS